MGTLLEDDEGEGPAGKAGRVGALPCEDSLLRFRCGCPSWDAPRVAFRLREPRSPGVEWAEGVEEGGCGSLAEDFLVRTFRELMDSLVLD